MPVDHKRFEELEVAVERGLGTFVEVGRALLEIQSRRLYRLAGHRTFADYLAKRWDLSSAYAYRQIEASKIIDILAVGESPLPANEAQARELTPLVDDPDAVRAVWSETVRQGEGHITARAIRDCVTARRPRTGRVAAALPTTPIVDPATCPACGHRLAG